MFKLKKIIENLNTLYAKVAFAEAGCAIHDLDLEQVFEFKYPRKTERVEKWACKNCSKRLYKTTRVD